MASNQVNEGHIGARCVCVRDLSAKGRFEITSCNSAKRSRHSWSKPLHRLPLPLIIHAALCHTCCGGGDPFGLEEGHLTKEAGTATKRDAAADFYLRRAGHHEEESARWLA